MADATIVKKQWGYVVGGAGTDDTAVTTDSIYVKRLLLTANDSADTIVVTDNAGSILVNWIAGAEILSQVFEIGAKLKGISVNPSAVDDFCSIVVE